MERRVNRKGREGIAKLRWEIVDEAFDAGGEADGFQVEKS